MMETFDLLLANSDRRVSNLIESLVRDVCRGDAIVNCTRVMRVDETLGEALDTKFDLIIINPENLAAAPGRPSAFASTTEATSTLRGIKSFRTAPIIAVAVSAQHEMLFSQAGADLVLGLPFNCEDLKSAVRRL